MDLSLVAKYRVWVERKHTEEYSGFVGLVFRIILKREGKEIEI